MSASCPVLATAADKHYVDQAKQVFSSAFHKGEWTGDFLLLSYGMRKKDEDWFLDKGIYVLRCGHISDGSANFPNPAIFSRYYLFDRESIKNWDLVVYLDADIIINTNLNPLLSCCGFNAAKDYYCQMTDKYLFKDVKSEELKFGFENKHVFSSGVMVFTVDIIRDGMFEELVRLTKKYHRASQWVDQLVLNIMFQDWNCLHKKWNLQLPENKKISKDSMKLANDAILHFIWQPKPWDISGHSYQEMWKRNLDNANRIRIK